MRPTYVIFKFDCASDIILAIKYSKRQKMWVEISASRFRKKTEFEHHFLGFSYANLL